MTTALGGGIASPTPASDAFDCRDGAIAVSNASAPISAVIKRDFRVITSSSFELAGDSVEPVNKERSSRLLHDSLNNEIIVITGGG